MFEMMSIFWFNNLECSSKHLSHVFRCCSGDILHHIYHISLLKNIPSGYNPAYPIYFMTNRKVCWRSILWNSQFLHYPWWCFSTVLRSFIMKTEKNERFKNSKTADQFLFRKCFFIGNDTWMNVFLYYKSYYSVTFLSQFRKKNLEICPAQILIYRQRYLS